MDTLNNDISMLNKIREFVKKCTLLVLVGFAVLSSGTAVYFYNGYSGLKQDPNKVAQEEINKLIAQVSKLIVLPEGEVPTIATVSDPEKLRDQAFFLKAKAGDKVLIYTTSKKAILYSPELNKIVEVAPINIGASATQTKE